MAQSIKPEQLANCGLDTDVTRNFVDGCGEHADHKKALTLSQLGVRGRKAPRW